MPGVQDNNSKEPYAFFISGETKELVAQQKIPFQHTRKLSLDTNPKMVVGI